MPLGLAVLSATMAPMSNVIDHSQVEKLRVLRAALLEAHRRTATTMKAGAALVTGRGGRREGGNDLAPVQGDPGGSSGVTACDRSILRRQGESTAAQHRG